MTRLGRIEAWFGVLALRLAALLLVIDGLLLAWYLLVPRTLLLSFHLDRENNVPTWYSAVQLALLSLLLLACAVEEASRPGSERSRPWGWVGAAVLFGLMSLDEIHTIHERLAVLVGETALLSGPVELARGRWPILGPMLGFAWVVLLAPLVLAVFAYLVWFFRARFRDDRPRSALALGALCLFATALVCETASIVDFGSDWYRYQVLIEEGAEMIGVSLLVLAVAGRLEVRLAPRGDEGLRRLQSAARAVSNATVVAGTGGALLLGAAYLHTGQPFDRGLTPDRWRASASHSSPSRLPALAFDRDPYTVWATGRPMRGGEWYELDLGRERALRRVCLYTGGYRNDYPRRLTVETSRLGHAWLPWTEDATGFSGLSSRICAQSPEPIPASAVRFTQGGSDPQYHWSIAEVYLYE